MPRAKSRLCKSRLTRCDTKSKGEEELALLFRAAKIPFEREFQFCDRGWRADFALPQHKIIVEFEGGVWTQGRHTRPLGFIEDMRKYNRATELGWRIFRCANAKGVSPAEVFDAVMRAAGMP